MITQRSAILSAVHPLRQIVLRELHSTALSYAGGGGRDSSSSKGRFESRDGPSFQRTSSSKHDPYTRGRRGSSPAPVRDDEQSSRSRGSGRDHGHAYERHARRLTPKGRAEQPFTRSRLEFTATDKVSGHANAGNGNSWSSSTRAVPTSTSSPTSRRLSVLREPTATNEFPLPRTDPAKATRAPFPTFPLLKTLLETLDRKKMKSTTRIQTLVLSKLTRFPKRTLIAAETGSGKTLAYLLPLFHHLKRTDKGNTADSESETQLLPRAIILSPSHELTRQSTSQAKSLCHETKLRIVGLSSSAGVTSSRGSVDLLFGTGTMVRKTLGLPGEGQDELREGVLSKDRVEWVVIDEADVLLGPDFLTETLATINHLSPKYLILASATLPPSLLAALPLLSPSPDSSSDDAFTTTKDGGFVHLLSPGLHKLPSKLETKFVHSVSGNILSDVAKEVKSIFAEGHSSSNSDGAEGDIESKVVIFVNTDTKVKALSEVLLTKGISNLAWTGEAKSRQRGTNGDLNQFLIDPNPRLNQDESMRGPKQSSPSPRVLVTTSLLSRGLDFPPETTVILLDQPRDVLDFVHRAGRAGRAGRKGKVVVFGMGLKGEGRLGKGLWGVLGKTSSEKRA